MTQKQQSCYYERWVFNTRDETFQLVNGVNGIGAYKYKHKHYY